MSAAKQRGRAEPGRIAAARKEMHVDERSPDRTSWRKAGTYLALAIVFLLLGAVPMWWRTREISAQRALVQRALTVSQMENRLSEAVIDARRGEYEPARQTANDFFATLRLRVDGGVDPAEPQAQREDLERLLAQRDDIISLLARSDPTAANRLSNLYVSYKKTMSGIQPQISNAR